MTDGRLGHWESVYAAKAADAVSWYQPTPEASLAALARLNVSPSAALIDIGGGASTLVDRLIDHEWTDVTVLDIATSALSVSQTRLGRRAGLVAWIGADITSWRPQRSFDVWHDRAVFHFLTEAHDRSAYCDAVRVGLRPGGMLIIGTFAIDGPGTCSGLPVQRYDARTLAAALGADFELVEQWREEHRTPWDSLQAFQWGIFHRVSG
jgi:SAM-dependent methyltransferase